MQHSRLFMAALCLILVGVSQPVFADLQSQLENVAAAERQVKHEQAKQHAEAQKRLRSQQLKQAQIQKRNQEYENELRQLKLLDKQLELQAKRARINRTNEYIDADLAARKAQTDTIQASADSKRNISSGMKTHLEKTGEAALKKTSK